MTTQSIPTRPPRARSPHGLLLAEPPSRRWTIAKLIGLVVLTASGVAITVGIVAGVALFTLLNFH